MVDTVNPLPVGVERARTHVGVGFKEVCLVLGYLHVAPAEILPLVCYLYVRQSDI
jgi:hypothetical protein